MKGAASQPMHVPPPETMENSTQPAEMDLPALLPYIG
jgi:hypothetical protein